MGMGRFVLVMKNCNRELKKSSGDKLCKNWDKLQTNYNNIRNLVAVKAKMNGKASLDSFKI